MANKKKGPEKWLPTHFAGEIPAEEETTTEESTDSKTPAQRYAEREEKLADVENLEDILRQELEEEGLPIPEKQNLSLMAIEEFQYAVQEATHLRRVIKATSNPKERNLAVKAFTHKRAEAERFLKYGASFEKAYREYIKTRQSYRAFTREQARVIALTRLLEEESFASLEATDLEANDVERNEKGKTPKDVDMSTNLDTAARAQLELVMSEISNEDLEKVDEAAILESTKLIYGEDSRELKKLEKDLAEQKGEPLPKTKDDIQKELTAAESRVQELWDDPMVRYLAGKAEVAKILAGYHRGDDVIESQSVIGYLNAIHEWEQQHKRTTIGGVAVGPPGVGKTTLFKHYLREKNRGYVYIDLSEDVTRYLLYGSKDIQFKGAAENHEGLADKLGGMEKETFAKFVAENADRMCKVFGFDPDDKDDADEATITAIRLIEEQLAAEKGVDESKVDEVQGKVRDLAAQLYRRELATDFSHLVKENGWRDGVVVAALRRGDSIIFDEFNKNKNWSLLYSLMTAKPGEEWYFADNEGAEKPDKIRIPEDWRIYFTANIGRRHGGFAVAEALASRAGGKVMEVDYPPVKEEMLVGLCALANPEGFWLRSKDDLAKLYVLINEVFPATREASEENTQSVSVSYRTLRDVAEKLVTMKNKEGSPVYQATRKSFDNAVFEVMVETQAALYEDKTVAKSIVDVGTSVGLFLNDELKDDVLKYISEDAYNERREVHAEHEDFEAIVAKVQGLKRDVMADAAGVDTRQF